MQLLQSTPSLPEMPETPSLPDIPQIPDVSLPDAVPDFVSDLVPFMIDSFDVLASIPF